MFLNTNITTIRSLYWTDNPKLCLIPNIYNVDLWFQKNVQSELGIIKKNVESVRDERQRNFMLTAFSATVNPVSNQHSDTKYASVEKNIQTGQTVRMFTEKINKMKKRMEEFSSLATNASCMVSKSSALSMKKISDSQIDFIVTSPPYANTYDYYLYHKHRMNWLGYDIKTPQSVEIGSRNKHHDNNLPITSYLESLKSYFSECNRVLRTGKFFCIVVGDAIKDGNMISMDKEMKNLSNETGFDLMQCFSYDFHALPHIIVQFQYFPYFPHCLYTKPHFHTFSHISHISHIVLSHRDISRWFDLWVIYSGCVSLDSWL